jgi:NADP-dependent 3-hydroxy acid dehydrogenase YdfG
VPDGRLGRAGVCRSEEQGRLGPIDSLVADAARSSVHGPLRESDPAHLWSNVSVTLLGVVMCVPAALPTMVEHKHGRIIARRP